MLPPTTVPDHIAQLSDIEAHELIRKAKAKLGQDVVVLGHHYQRDEVIEHADFTGDSLKLARIGREQSQAKYMIFCGVHFMAETCVMLAHPNKEVCLPDMGAGCDMADMAEYRDVAEAWQDAERAGARDIIPVTYINSSAALKAFVGAHGGVICTSSNARAIVTWALEKGKHLFFFPDQHLGRNICKGLGLDPSSDMLLWDPTKFLGGHPEEKVLGTKVWLWQGHCPVHALFSVHQIKKLRSSSPQIKIIVHPECAMEVVDLADFSGSTDFIIRTIGAAAEGTSWAVGTEKHLVERLAKAHPNKHIVSLNPFTCLCGTMNRISVKHLAWVFDSLIKGEGLPNKITVDPETSRNSILALERMLTLS